ncbi:MAG: Rpn family recombination-promoting nuclease/putative transposase [Desulfobacterales bacterium]|nr:Rpn family recombination-promoting nuclease/putative transposase [Desulfobacterales bacterium]
METEKTVRDLIQNPNDKLVRTVFSDPAEAGSFFQAYLPESLTERIDWNTLTLKETSFVDEEFRNSESDLLFHAMLKKTGKEEKQGEIFLYLLFEHQSAPQKWMRFRVLKYKCRIWDESFKEFPKQKGLVPIVPVVFYQGKTAWNYETKFSDLYLCELPDMSFAPEFSHFLVDQSGWADDEIRGTLKAKIAQLLIKAKYHGKLIRMFRRLVRLLSKLPETGGINFMRVFLIYIIETQEQETVSEFAKLMKKQSKKMEGEMTTAAEAYMREGKIEGRMEGKMETTIEMIENLLKEGVDWKTIQRATGIDQKDFKKLREKWQNN